MRLLATLNEEGITIIYVTHNPRMAEFAGRVIHVYDGKLLENEQPATLKGDSQ